MTISEPIRSSNDLSRREFLKETSLAAVWLAIPAARGVGPRPDLRPATEHEAMVALAWFDLSLHLVRTTAGFSPPVAARTFAYLGLALYESLVPGIPGYRSSQGQIADFSAPESTRRERLHWPTVANAALAHAVRSLFRPTTLTNHAAIDQLETSLRPSRPPLLVEASISWGKQVAEAVLAYSASDGGHDGHLRNFPTDYSPPVGPGLWAPTPPGFQRALQPYWGENRTFAVPSGGHCVSGDHPGYSTAVDSQFFRDAVEVYDVTAALTEEQRDIARFWSDDPGETATPPGHSISILSQVIDSMGLDLASAAQCYLKVGLAVSDAFVTCWNTKYRYNLVRPVTYIRSLIDDQWEPFLATPPFPEFTSGHSVQSGAAFRVMADLFGDAQHLVDHTHDARGLIPRTFTSFSQCAEEAAISRLYGGIHFMPAIELGLTQGECVADAISHLRLMAGRARR